MTDLDLPALRAVAERATPGPMDVWSIPQIDAVRDMQNMLSPARMLALLDRLEKAEKAADAVAVHATNLTLDNSTLRRDNARLADQRDLMRVSVDRWRGRAIVAETKIDRVTGVLETGERAVGDGGRHARPVRRGHEL